ncbi:hypothetical protein JTB14_001948 [Gonioctena quinquepunctata]|nr:hypothetical protein JTB14_001948 [Gonioctena quinquepunctata]
MVRSILVLVSTLVNAEYVLCRPHSNSAKQISKRDIFPSIPIFNRVFRNRNPEGTPMSKLFGDDSSTFTNNDYIYQIPTWNDNNLEEYTGESDNDLEISSEERTEPSANLYH